MLSEASINALGESSDPANPGNDTLLTLVEHGREIARFPFPTKLAIFDYLTWISFPTRSVRRTFAKLLKSSCTKVQYSIWTLCISSQLGEVLLKFLTLAWGSDVER